MKATIETNDTTFENEVLKANVPVIVDFHADWCGPCRMLAPALEEVAQENAGRIKVAKVNVDDNPELANRYRVQSLPTLLYFAKGELRDQSIGVVSKKAMLARVDALLPVAP